MATLTQSLGFLNSITSACPLHGHRTVTATPQHSIMRSRRLIRSSSHQENPGTDDSRPPTPPMVDRRDVLLALGGLQYGAISANMALANPVAPPDFATCHTATSPGLDPSNPLLQCCPPYTTPSDVAFYDYPKTTLRVRRPAQEVVDDDEYMEKYTSAVKAMKNLAPDDPWNFYQQAKIHCAYCNDAFDQTNYPTVPLQVHGSWLFLPWHRFYLHFYERILGKLIDDDTFALPFWNWDSPDGMPFPSLFTPTASPLYDPKRNPNHVATSVPVDYQYGYKEGDRPGVTPAEIVAENISQMRQIFKQSLPLAELFMGDPLRAGEPADVADATGRLESIHNAVHQWVGPVDSPHIDMGNFVTAASDSVFFCHHANVDRMWQIYRGLRGYAVEFNDNDWLDSSFDFYDENRKVVRVKVQDALNMSKFCYTYQEVPLPWLGKPASKKPAETKTKTELALVPVVEFGLQPRKLDSTIRVLVPRPKKSRSKSDKDEKVEVLFIKGITVNSTGPARFDVYVAAPYGELAGPGKGELAGNFIKLPHSLAPEVVKKAGKVKTAMLKLGITSVVEDLGAEDVEKLVVTLVPRFGDVTVGGVAIKLLQTDFVV